MSRPSTISLEDKYLQSQGDVYLSAMQALVRLPMLQRSFDLALGRNTAGFVSGYRGSPIGGYDRELWRARESLERHHVRFQPGLNEDLAATACWGTQQLGLFPGARYDGVFAAWYGKSPGLDRSSDAIKHASHAGTSPLGGVLAIVGDDHLAKSSAFGHQSEYVFVDCLMPVLAPSDIPEILELGLFGWALSRYCGAWVGFKLAGSTCESSAVVSLPQIDADWPRPADFELPPDGVHLRWPDDPAAMERRAKLVRLPAAQAFARAARVDRIEGTRSSKARLGLIAAGRAYGQLREALTLLGLEDPDLAHLGIRIYKPALVWPLDPVRLGEFLEGLDTVLVIEDKRPLIEDQVKVILHDRHPGRTVRVIGKHDERGEVLLPEPGELDTRLIAAALARRLSLSTDRLAGFQSASAPAAAADPAHLIRTPYFCSGCPHNTSTRLPDQSLAIGGIGCHTLSMFMDRGMRTFTHMGGEGASWIGLAPFTDLPHVFQNVGDGTYQHSGSLGIRAAVAAGVNVTFKLLYNDAVAMTGGQPVEGQPTVPQITRQLAAEGVRTIVVVTDEPDKYESSDPFAPGVEILHRDVLDTAQRRLREVPGVSVLVYDQTCAAEKRRRRKVGAYPDPARRVVINPLVCEGCGDCGVQSNCLSIAPRDTDFGIKRRIDQASCNKDYSCVKGFCPSFVTVEGGRLKHPAPRDPGRLPDPPHVTLAADRPYRLLLAGIGGTGIVTVGAILGVAARSQGLAASVNDVTGMAQKGGPVFGHVQIATQPAQLASDRIAAGRADLLIAQDLVVATMPDALARLGPQSRVVANSDTVETGAFTADPRRRVDGSGLLEQLRAATARVDVLPALAASEAGAGDPVGAGLLLLGTAVQLGLVPLGVASIENAIRLNGVAVERNLAAFAWGRRLAGDPGALDELGIVAAQPATLDAFIARRIDALAQYQDRDYAARYAALVDRAREAERRCAAESDAFTRAVADVAYTLMAYKDEYEVARLHLDPTFAQEIAARFEGDYRLRYHLAPPLLARIDPATGRPRKMTFGGWIRPVFVILRGLRGLRGTAFDPFGYTAERRLERALIEEYLALVEELCAGLTPQRHPQAVAVARWPQSVRGFGPVKHAALERAQRERDALLAEWRSAGER
jgi:indolepyruvate ferredoxin oxidoreductase